MRYFDTGVSYFNEPNEFDNKSSKEILQFAVGGLLYMPASNEKISKKIISGDSGIKSFVLDLEDSLGDDLVGFGLRTITKIISDIANAVDKGKMDYSDIPLIFVRVRDFGQMKKVNELLGTNMSIISGFNIPKFSKDNCSQYIDEFVGVNAVVNSSSSNSHELYIMPIIEDKLTLYRQLRMENLLYMNDKLRNIVSNVLNIRVGGNDFCSTLGIRRGIRDTIYDIGPVRSVLNDIVNVFGKSYIVSGPVWEYFSNKDNPNDTAWKVGLEHELYMDRLNGFIGKTCIHPSQLPVVQKSLIVPYADYMDAISILGMNQNAEGVKKSAEGNRMNEAKTHTNWAKKVIGLANIYGVEAP